MLHVAHNTNDRHPVVGVVSSRPVNTPSNRVLSGKKLPRQCLVHDGHSRLSFAVHGSEVASGANGNLHDAEVITHDGQHLYQWFGSHRGRGLPVDYHAMSYIISGEGKIGDHCRLHPGEGINSLKQFLAEIVL